MSDFRIRNIIGQQRSTFNFGSLMDHGKILLANLSKGRLGEITAHFLGMLLAAKLEAAALKRVRIPRERRRNFYLYVDEFHNLATANFSTMLSEARKFRLSLILANQFIAQVPDQIRAAIMGNVGTAITFRIGREDAEVLARTFAPTPTETDLVRLPNFHAYATTLCDGEATRPFSLRIERPSHAGSDEVAQEVVSRSRAKYSRAREEVEGEVALTLSASE
jgi:hypothetical protein